MIKFLKILISFFIAVIYLVSCSKTDIVQEEPQPYRLAVPLNFPAFEDDPHNPLSETGVALGRRLFYDVRLSGNNKISCASCHQQQLAFSDGTALSNMGVSGTKLLRHAPALINLAWARNGLFWDGGSTNLESQAFGPLSAHDEMAQDLYQLVEELNADGQYPQLFRAAFKQEVSAAGVVKALAQFQRTMVSANSSYDKYRRNEGAVLSSKELRGLQLVQQKCQQCHATDLFTDNSYHNNGLDDDFSIEDHDNIYKGRFRVSYHLSDLGAYRTPTLRNIMLTAPYMHDARFASIEAVLDHYSDGVKSSSSLSPELYQKENRAPGITLSAEDKASIIAFLHTLTDADFITNKTLSNPDK